MTDRDPAGLARTAVAALGRVGCRGVLARGWAALASASDDEDLVVVDEVPHDWLFARVAAVVHHGGAGTTHTGLRAGIPMWWCRSSPTSPSGPVGSPTWAPDRPRFLAEP